MFRQFDWTLTLYNPDLRIFAVKSYNCQAITIREPSTCLRYETVYSLFMLMASCIEEKKGRSKS